MSSLGRNVLGSSKLPARIVTRSGAEEGSPKSGEPQSPQNSRVVACPLSAVTVKELGVPFVTANACFGTPRTGMKAPPDSRWQSRQWQLEEKSGWAVKE